MTSLLGASYDENGNQIFDPNEYRLSQLQKSQLATATGLNRKINLTRPDIARGLLATYVTNIAATSGAISVATLDKMAPWIAFLMRSTAWPKIRELWFPVGETSDAAGLATATVKLKYPSGAAVALTNTGPFVGADWSQTLALVNTVASGKKLVSDFNPSVQFASQGELGFATYMFGANARGIKNADTGSGANQIAYAGAVGNAGGSNANSNYFTINGTSLIARISNGTTNTGVAAGMGRYRAVQQTAGVTQAWFGAYIGDQVANAAPSGNNTVYCVGGAAGSNEFPGSVGGAAFFDTLTAAEHGDMTDFFDGLSIALGRNIFFEEVCCIGDSNTFVYGNGPQAPVAPNRWMRALADELGLAEQNQGVPGARISPYDGNLGTPTRIQQRMIGLSSRINLMMPGVNDVADYSSTPALATKLLNQLGSKSNSINNYELLIASAVLARVPNIMLLGLGKVNWPVAAALVGTSFAGVGVDRGQIQDWNQSVKALAAKYNVGFFDISGINVNQTDGVHNTSACQAAIAAGIVGALRAQVF